MKLYREGISNVRVFMPSCGAGFDRGGNKDGSSLVVRWESVHDDKGHVIFVNGKTSAVILDGEQRQAVIGVGFGVDEPVRVSVWAVETDELNINDIDGDDIGSGRVRLLWAKVMGLGIDSEVEVFSDEGGGEVDYGSRVNYRDIYGFDSWQDKCGFGMSMFGMGDFGYDSQACAGFGAGVFGLGDFGFGSYAGRWESEPLSDADYVFGLRTVDGAGLIAAAGVNDSVRIIGRKYNKGELRLSGFDEADQLVFNY